MLPVFSEGGTRCLAKFVEWFLHIFARSEAWVLTGGSGAVPLTALKANTSVFNLMRAIHREPMEVGLNGRMLVS